ncbi:methyltransferase domain-containing protein [Nocardioidaceae bacterium]|nr:methyltransferase domain-containing protein [Nocardioidaceae bacterium]
MADGPEHPERPGHAGLTPSGRRYAARTAVLWDSLLAAVAARGAGPCHVVDVGGGTGQLAVRLAEQGHRVTVVDPSPDALAALGRRAREAGVDDRVTGRQGDLVDTPDLVAAGDAGPAEVVLCHGVLEIVRDPAAALDTLRATAGDDGLLSLLVAQRHAAVLARAMAGHLQQALSLLDEVGPVRELAEGGRTPQRRFTAEEITTLLTDHGFAVHEVHGVRVFADLVPGALLDAEAGATESLLALERAVAHRPEFHAVATQLHLLARPV